MDFQFKFSVGDTVYGIKDGTLAEYRVLMRKYEEDADWKSVVYEVCKPGNTGNSLRMEEQNLYSDKEVAVNVLIEEENGRHAARIREINSI